MPLNLPTGERLGRSASRTPFPKSAFLWGWSGSGSVIQGHSDHGASKEPMNPLWSWIHRFLWCAMIWVILDHWSWSRSPERNAPENPVRIHPRNLSYKNEFDFHENEPVGGTHFHMNGFTRRLVLKQRQKATRKWPTGHTGVICKWKLLVI